MTFRPPVRLDALIAWCRAMKHGLDIGLTPLRVFRQQAKSGPATLQAVAVRLADRLETGSSLSDALVPEANQFPRLFVEMLAVGEQAGRLPDVLGELEAHYEAVRRARKQLLTAIAWPAFSYVSAIAVIAMLIFVLGMITPAGGKPLDVIGLGLVGASGAFFFVVIMSLLSAVVVGGVLIVANDPNARSKAEALALKVPGFAGCVRAFALNRFAMTFHMSAEAGLQTDRAIQNSLRATANAVYAATAERSAKAARKGEEVHKILATCGETLFPHDFVESARLGDETGQLPEVMKKQAVHYGEESVRKMKALAAVAGFAVYGCVSVLIIVMIFRIFMAAYINPMNQMLDDVNAAKMMP